MSPGGWGLAALANGAETAYLQHIDLASESTLGTRNQVRLADGLEFNSARLNQTSKPENWLCGGQLNLGSSVVTGEIAFNDLTLRRHMTLPQTAAWLESHRPSKSSYFMDWETLTHYGNP